MQAPGVKQFRIRLAKSSEMDELVHQRHMMFEDMRHRTAEEHAVGDESYRHWASSLIKRRLLRCYVVVNSKDEIVSGGCIWLREVQPAPGRPAGRVPYLLSMYTEPEYRRKGLATMVVKEAMRWSRNHGYKLMTLHASAKGRKVYAKLGWERTWEMRAELE